LTIFYLKNQYLFLRIILIFIGDRGDLKITFALKALR